MKSAYFAIVSLLLATTAPVVAQPFSINDALKQATLTNPGVGEASANRRATESELRQTQSTLLPQVRLEARYGPEKFDQSAAVVSSSATPIPALPLTAPELWTAACQSPGARACLFGRWPDSVRLASPSHPTLQ